jgi:hypothetical protein
MQRDTNSPLLKIMTSHPNTQTNKIKPNQTKQNCDTVIIIIPLEAIDRITERPNEQAKSNQKSEISSVDGGPLFFRFKF